MTLTQLRYLIAIADSGLNITTAAERVHATQPGVSKQLKQLEDELGFQLFSPEITKREMAFYKTKQNAFGLPLDNRETYTKLDWIVWTAHSGDR